MDYLDVLWRRKWGILLGTLFCAVVAGAISLVLPKAYEAKVLLLLSKPGKVQLKKENAIQFELVPEYSARTYEGLLRNPLLFQKLLDKTGLSELTLDQLGRQMKVSALEETSLIELKARHRDPAVAARLVNAWARLFVDQQRALSLRDIQAAEKIISDQLKRAGEDLAEREDQFKTFSAISQIEFLKASIKENINQINKLSTQLEHISVDLYSKQAEVVASIQGVLNLDAGLLRSQISVVEEMIEQADVRIAQTQKILSEQPPRISLTRSLLDDIFFLQRHSSSAPPASKQPDGTHLRVQVEEVNPVVTNLQEALFEDQRYLTALKAEERALKARREELGQIAAEARQYEPSKAEELLEHLLVKSTAYRPSRWDDQLQKLLELSIEVQSLKAKREQTLKSLQHLRVRLNEAKQQFASERLREEELSRAVESSRVKFDVLKNKADELQITRSTVPSTVKVATEAAVPTEYVTPRRRTTVALAGFFGLILSTLIVFFKEYLDRGHVSRSVATGAPLSE